MRKVTKFNVSTEAEDQWIHIGPEVPIPRDDVLKGDWNAGYIHWIRDDDSRDVERPMQFCVHHTDEDVTIRVQIHGDEFIYVLEGSFTIELDSGETFTFNQGEAVHFRPGISGRWTYHAPFRQLVIIIYGHGVPERTEVHAR